MRTAIWLFAALCLWWLVSTIGCGELVCVPYILLFYSPFWLPIVAYIAGSEWASRTFAGKWSELFFAGLVLIGSAYLLYILKTRHPKLFIDAEASMVPVGMIIKPTVAVAALYFVKMIRDRWARPTQTRKVKESGEAL